MHDLLIVEDEAVERQYLEKIARSLHQEEGRVFSAANGLEGLRLFQTERPAIVITDIYMPMMDGLQMIREIKRTAPDTLCYVLTSYDYFSYCQQAIKLGVEDFVLKPLNRAGFRELLSSARQIVQARTRKNQLSLRINSLEAKIEKDCFGAAVLSQDLQLFLENAELLGLSGKEPCFYVCLPAEQQASLRQALVQAGHTVISGETEPGAVLFSFLTKEAGPDPDWIRSLPEAAGAFRISGLYPDAEHLLEGWKEQSARPEKEENRLQAIEEDILLDLAARLVSCAEQGQPVPEALMQDFVQLKTLGHIRRLYEKSVRMTERLLQLRYGEHRSLEYTPDPMTPPGMVLVNLWEKAGLVIAVHRRMRTTARYRQVTCYIENSLHQPISLSDAASELGVSVYYLSRLLNQHGESSFSDLLHVFRIEKAKQLIRSDQSFKQVAWSTGYNSQSYFSKNFRRLTGVSPSEYKELCDQFASRS